MQLISQSLARLLATVLLVSLLVSGCGGPGPADKPAAKAPFRVAVLLMQDENNVFMPNDTTLADFGDPLAGDAVLEVGGGLEGDYMKGFVKMAREYGGVELVGLTSWRYPKIGQRAGWVQQEAYQHMSDTMLAELRDKGPFDAVYLALHGAMSVRDVPYAEAELARRVREVVGPKAVLVGTFDPHGNQGSEFFRWANLAFTSKYYPHYDDRLQGERAARTMIRMLRGEYTPAVAVRKPPILSADVNQWTGVSPWMDIVQRALVWEARSPDVYVNFFAGYPWADVPEVGMAFQVITNGDQQLADRIADDLSAFAWKERQALMSVTPIEPLQRGMDKLEAAIRAKQLPAIVADYSDRTFRQVWVLGEIVKRGLADTIVAAIKDPRAVETLLAQNAKVGDRVKLSIGGHAGPEGGPAVPIEGELIHLAPGPNNNMNKGAPQDIWAAVRYGKNNVVVFSPSGGDPTAPEHLRFGAIKPEDYKIFVTKHRVHFRSGFVDSGYVKTVILIDPPGPFLGTTHLDALPYKKVDPKKYFPWGTPAWPESAGTAH